MNLLKKFAFVTFFVFLIIGCYETEEPTFDGGEQTPIAGTFHCENRIDGSKIILIFTEQRIGTWPFTTYSYSLELAGKDEDYSACLLKKTPSDLFIMQCKNAENLYEYSFVDFIEDNTFFLLFSDLMGKGDYVENLLEKYNVEFKEGSQTGSIILGSDKKNIEKFFFAHDKSIMTVVAKCERSSE